MNIRQSVLPMVRKTCLTTAIVAGALSAASLFKAPGQTLNPNGAEPKTWYDKITAEMYGTLDKKSRKYEYDNNASVAKNVDRAVDVANNNIYDKVIDPITDKPELPLTTTALALLGLSMIDKKGNKIQDTNIQNTMNKTTL